MGNLPYFYITDGTAANKVDFFSLRSPYHLLDWTPSTAKLKNDGVWQSSPFWDGRRLIASARENISDVLTIAVSGGDMDTVIDNMRKLRLILEKAVYYWTSEWQREPVYLVARGDCETNTRYAIIKGYSMPNDDNPYEPPLGGAPASKAMVNIVLNIEHGLWQHVVPGTSEQVAIKSTDCWDYPYSLEFDGATSSVDCGSDASLDNLADNAFTAEAWVYYASRGSGNVDVIIGKTGNANRGWRLIIDNTSPYDLHGRIYAAALIYSRYGISFPLQQWVHVAMTWDDAADRRVNLFVGGVPIGASGTIITGAGAITPDAGDDLFIGATNLLNDFWTGYIGWSRISNFVRYGGIFQPPPRCVIPQVDAGTLGLWIHEGTGTAIDNIEGTAARDGLANNCTWHSDCCDDYD
jgi:hypothetical protein